MTRSFGAGHVVVEGDDALLASVRAALGPAQRREVVVTDAATASQALLSALGGPPLLVHARASRGVVDVLCDDLRRLGRVDLVDAGTSLPDQRMQQVPALPESGPEILELLAQGRTLGQAATALGLSRRTADRRLAATREALGARSTAEAVAVWVASGRT